MTAIIKPCTSLATAACGTAEKASVFRKRQMPVLKVSYNRVQGISACGE